MKQNRGDFLSDQGTPFAKVNPKTHGQLSSLQLPENLILLGMMPRDGLKERIETAVEIFPEISSCSLAYLPTHDAWLMPLIEMDIVVIGPSTMANNLAEELTRHQLQLDDLRA